MVASYAQKVRQGFPIPPLARGIPGLGEYQSPTGKQLNYGFSCNSDYQVPILEILSSQWRIQQEENPGCSTRGFQLKYLTVLQGLEGAEYEGIF